MNSSSSSSHRRRREEGGDFYKFQEDYQISLRTLYAVSQRLESVQNNFLNDLRLQTVNAHTALGLLSDERRKLKRRLDTESEGWISPKRIRREEIAKMYYHMNDIVESWNSFQNFWRSYLNEFEEVSELLHNPTTPVSPSPSPPPLAQEPEPISPILFYDTDDDMSLYERAQSQSQTQTQEELIPTIDNDAYVAEDDDEDEDSQEPEQAQRMTPIFLSSDDEDDKDNEKQE